MLKHADLTTKRFFSLNTQAYKDGALQEKKEQWRAFVRQGRIELAPHEFGEVVQGLAEFLGPLLHSLVTGDAFAVEWCAPGPWM